MHIRKLMTSSSDNSSKKPQGFQSKEQITDFFVNSHIIVLQKIYFGRLHDNAGRLLGDLFTHSFHEEENEGTIAKLLSLFSVSLPHTTHQISTV